MTGPLASGASNPNKIKGGRWTVARFCLLAVGHSIAWFVVSSLLGHYSQRFGPQILLELNIAFYLPSVPLLVASSFFDRVLDETFGVAPVILARLIFGLGGCAALMAAFPFIHDSIGGLLGAVTALGLASAVAFSASYQLVARFANKNVVALGLGCVGSGLVALLVETALLIPASPTRAQELWLFEITAGIILLGLGAAVSLLLRHWARIEAWRPISALEEPLLAAPEEGLEGDHEQQIGAAPSAALAGDGSAHSMQQEGSLRGRASALSIGGRLGSLEHLGSIRSSLTRRMSTPQINYAPLDPFQPVSEGEAFGEDVFAGSRTLTRRSLQRDTIPAHIAAVGRPREPPLASPFGAADAQQGPSQPGGQPGLEKLFSRGAALPDASKEEVARGMAAGQGPGAARPPRPSEDGTVGGGQAMLIVWQRCWAIQVALLLSGLYFVIIFPFFTYVRSSGACGALLPKILFFVRLGADLCGRTLPRVPGCTPSSPFVLLALGVAMAASTVPFFAYLKAPEGYLHDWLPIAYVVACWMVGGYINTCAYVMAPPRVPGPLRASANGLLAITYQGAHTSGLLVAGALMLALFGGGR